MPIPLHCPNPACPHFEHPPARWKVRFGSYATLAHGTVNRYRCSACGRTFSDQTESMHYFAKRRLPLFAIARSLNAGAPMRDTAARYHTSPAAIRNAVLRLGRQAMIAQIHLLDALPPQHAVAFDGLRSFVTSQDYPCDITTVVTATGEMILTMIHSITKRGGTTTQEQQKRCKKKYDVWVPKRRATKDAILLLCHEMLDYLRHTPTTPITIDTDEHPLYRAILTHQPCYRHLKLIKRLRHIRTSGRAPRTITNRLFPVNYVDRLIRHREKEHMRETIAFGRHTTVQMHRTWLFAWNHNTERPWREKQPKEGTHALNTGIGAEAIKRVRAEFYTRRKRVTDQGVPDSIRKVFLSEAATPPVRWRKGQKGTTVRVPFYAADDLLAAISTGL